MRDELLPLESPMDTTDDATLAERPASARAWAQLYAAERGHSDWFSLYSCTNHLIIISDCGKGTNPYGYTFADFLDLENEEAHMIIM